MNEGEVAQYILDHLPGVETAENFGYTFFFYGSDRKLPFATLTASDNEYDLFQSRSSQGLSPQPRSEQANFRSTLRCADGRASGVRFQGAG